MPSYPQYLEAASAARRIYGVTGAPNHLEVVLPLENRRDDATLTAMANNALSLNVAVPDAVKATASNRYALIPNDSDVVAEAEGNTVMLSGHVRTWAEHDAAMNAAWMARGVYLVRDHLSVTG